MIKLLLFRSLRIGICSNKPWTQNHIRLSSHSWFDIFSIDILFSVSISQIICSVVWCTMSGAERVHNMEKLSNLKMYPRLEIKFNTLPPKILFDTKYCYIIICEIKYSIRNEVGRYLILCR